MGRTQNIKLNTILYGLHNTAIKFLVGDVGLRVRELIRQTCEHLELEMLRGGVSKDYVHLLISAPPNISPSEIMKRIKGRSSTKLPQECPILKERYWRQRFWARGYFCVTAGELTENFDVE